MSAPGTPDYRRPDVPFESDAMQHRVEFTAQLYQLVERQISAPPGPQRIQHLWEPCSLRVARELGAVRPEGDEIRVCQSTIDVGIGDDSWILCWVMPIWNRDLPPSTNGWLVLPAMVGGWFVCDLLFVRICRLGTVGWKRTDYAWLALASVWGPYIVSADIKRPQNYRFCR
jgi:hypothetical protein